MTEETSNPQSLDLTLSPNQARQALNYSEYSYPAEYHPLAFQPKADKLEKELSAYFSAENSNHENNQILQIERELALEHEKHLEENPGLVEINRVKEILSDKISSDEWMIKFQEYSPLKSYSTSSQCKEILDNVIVCAGLDKQFNMGSGVDVSEYITDILNGDAPITPKVKTTASISISVKL
jgi:hypothetical protein